jgi:hypothetical protein
LQARLTLGEQLLSSQSWVSKAVAGSQVLMLKTPALGTVKA